MPTRRIALTSSSRGAHPAGEGWSSPVNFIGVRGCSRSPDSGIATPALRRRLVDLLPGPPLAEEVYGALSKLPATFTSEPSEVTLTVTGILDRLGVR